MAYTLTKSELLSLLHARGPQRIGPMVGYVQSIAREDGSGRSFNVHVIPVDRKPGDSKTTAIHVRTVD